MQNTTGPDETPHISVIMAVHNGAAFLAETLDSILSQTFTAFEYLVVDDASTDETPQILQAYAARDARLQVLTNATNRERSFSRNRALCAARAPLVAVMDADDRAHPERLAKQYRFFQANPEVTVCGSWLAFYESGKIWSYPTGNEDIRAQMWFSCPLGHPSIMFRKDPVLAVGGYAVEQPPAEDYGLWVRLAQIPTVRFANIPEPLVRYRAHPGKDRAAYYHKQATIALGICRAQLADLGIPLPEKDAPALLSPNGHTGPRTKEQLLHCGALAKRVLRQNKTRGLYPPEALRKAAHEYWLQSCLRFAENMGENMPDLFWIYLRRGTAPFSFRTCHTAAQFLTQSLSRYISRVLPGFPAGK